jgi:hypothetical protein
MTISVGFGRLNRMATARATAKADPFGDDNKKRRGATTIATSTADSPDSDQLRRSIKQMVGDVDGVVDDGEKLLRFG